MKIITHIREYKAKSTPGKIFIDNEHFCYTLEDIPRLPNVKIPGATCIPEGCYYADVSWSPKFRRDLIMLTTRNHSHKAMLMKNGVSFVGVRVHGGNSVDDSEACPLVGKMTNHEDKIWDCAEVEKKLTEVVKSNGRCLWVITSL